MQSTSQKAVTLADKLAVGGIELKPAEKVRSKIVIDEKKKISSCRMMNDVASDDEEDSRHLRRQRKSVFGF